MIRRRKKNKEKRKKKRKIIELNEETKIFRTIIRENTIQNNSKHEQ
jgi:hypothetical protein